MQEEARASLSPATAPEPARRGLSARHLACVAGAALIAYGADQASKAWATDALSDGRSREVLGSLLTLHLTHNPGAAFSLGTNSTIVITAIAAAVVVALLITARRLRSLGWSIAFGLIIGGALGNLTDRFVRPPGGGKGHVVDFLQLPHWPIFNVADSAICCAAALIVVLTFRGVHLDGTRDGDDTPGGASRSGAATGTESTTSEETR